MKYFFYFRYSEIYYATYVIMNLFYDYLNRNFRSDSLRQCIIRTSFSGIRRFHVSIIFKKKNLKQNSSYVGKNFCLNGTCHQQELFLFNCFIKIFSEQLQTQATPLILNILFSLSTWILQLFRSFKSTINLLFTLRNSWIVWSSHWVILQDVKFLRHYLLLILQVLQLKIRVSQNLAALLKIFVLLFRLLSLLRSHEIIYRKGIDIFQYCTVANFILIGWPWKKNGAYL